MGCKDKKNKKLVLYYDPTDQDSNAFESRSTDLNSDNTTFGRKFIHKQYLLRNASGEILGEAQLLEHTIDNTECKIFHDLFKLKLKNGVVPEQYNIISMGVTPRPLVKKLDLMHTLGKPSFNHLKWEWPEPNNPSKKRKLTFSKKEEN